MVTYTSTRLGGHRHRSSTDMSLVSHVIPQEQVTKWRSNIIASSP